MAKNFKPKLIYVTDDVAFEDHGAAILLLIREGIAHDWVTLCRALNLDPRAFNSSHLELRDTLIDLIDTGLLISENDYQGPYQLTDLWHNIQQALGISLVQAANLTYYDSIAVRPLFGKPTDVDISQHIFVLMPFEKAMQPIYNSIKRVCRELKISVKRADDFFTASAIIDDIWSAICNSGVIVADCTNRNPNVFYEIGIAHTVGKSVVLISQQDEDVPFDINYIRYIRYTPTASGLRKLERDLRRTLNEVGKSIWAT